MKSEAEIQQRAEELQSECHAYINALIESKRPKTFWELFTKRTPTHQDITNVWMFRKLAELELKLENTIQL